MEPSGNGDHGCIVGGELEFRQECRPSSLAALLFDTGAQTAVRRHSSTYRDLLDTSMLGSLDQLIHQYVYQCLLEACAYVLLVLLHELGILGHMVAHEVKQRSLYAAEAVVESGDMRLRELVFQRISLLCQTVHDRTSRIAQSHHFRTLVEGLTDSIIYGLTEDLVFKRTVYADNL